ncbi:hypothetical protein [Candidatus Chlorohelix sp.]|uniref:hypothetical protein n=1 Tax=Candidatus Chlorohelix sp. TaxID=3139201 RepID=UPI003049C9C6
MEAIERGLIARPSLLMIEELSQGLALVIIETLLEIIQTVNCEGTTILIVEAGCTNHIGIRQSWVCAGNRAYNPDRNFR